MITKRVMLLMIIIDGCLLLASYLSIKEEMVLVIPEIDKTVDNSNPTNSRPATKDGGIIQIITTEDKHDGQNIIKDSDSIEHNSSKHTYYTNVTESKNTTVIKPQVKEKLLTADLGSSSYNVNISDPKEEVKVIVDPVNNDIQEVNKIPKDNNQELKQPPIEKDLPNKEEIAILCENAWFDEYKPYDYIPDNLKPTDDLERIVPYFFTSQEAWDWGEQQIEDENSKYGCRGFSRMDGYQNDGTQFFFAYLKVCDIN